MGNKYYERIGEQVYSDKLPNGLSIFVMPKRGFNKSYAFFATDYGGADRRFCVDGTWIDTPAGVAHFLEHKMFDTEDGNALANLSANGASPNAFTSSDITAYFFESTEKFEENLEILLSFVSVPYFTDESMQKEQGIIGQEIRMTEDEPDYAVYYGLMKLLFRNNPIRDSVAGSVESISEISAKTLYDCHRIFYNPSNMALCVAGDVDPARIVQIARKILPETHGAPPKRDYGDAESLSPVSPRAAVTMEVSQPMFLAGCSAVSVSDGMPHLRREITGGLTLEMLAGRSSPLYLRLYGEGLIGSDFGAAFESAAGVGYSMIGGQSRDPDAVFEAFKAELDRVLAQGLDGELFERVKKAAFGRQMRSLNSFDGLCHSYASGHFRGYDAHRAFDVLLELTQEDVLDFIRDNLRTADMAISCVLPGTEAAT
jgi:predicted Zn-dependent peptidase